MIALFASMLTLGAVHGLGPDHCLAVSALAARGERKAVLRTALLFGAGHSAILFGFALLLGGLGKTMPAGWERAGEIANGALLVILGAGLAFERLRRVFSIHSHLHVHGGAPHLHLHAHCELRPATQLRPRFLSHRPAAAVHRHGHRSGVWAIGAVFALSGVRNAAMALPVALQGAPLAAGLALACFGVGVVAAMAGYGWAFGAAQDVARSRGLSERTLRLAVGCACAAFGCYWIAIA